MTIAETAIGILPGNALWPGMAILPLDEIIHEWYITHSLSKSLHCTKRLLTRALDGVTLPSLHTVTVKFLEIDMIHAHITGRLTRNAELKTIGDNQVLNFALATDHGYGDKKQALFLNCALWGKRASTLVNYLTKGSQIVVHGELFTRDYQKDGATRTSLELRVSEIDLVGSKSENGQHTEAAPVPTPTPSAPHTNFDDDIPF